VTAFIRHLVYRRPYNVADSFAHLWYDVLRTVPYVFYLSHLWPAPKSSAIVPTSKVTDVTAIYSRKVSFRWSKSALKHVGDKKHKRKEDEALFCIVRLIDCMI